MASEQGLRLELKDVRGYPGLGKIEVGGHVFCIDRKDLEPIVRAVNCHDDLVDALQACAAVCAGEVFGKQGLIDALEKARAAIAKAQS